MQKPANIVYKSMRHPHDYGYAAEINDCKIDCFKTVKAHLWDDDGDTFCFAQIMLCPEINSVYIVSCYGFAYSSYDDEGEFMDPTGYPHEWCCLCDEIITPFLNWPNKPDIQLFEQDIFDARNVPIKEELMKNAKILENAPLNLHGLIINNIYEQSFPNWLKIGEDNIGPHSIDFKAQLTFHPFLSSDSYAKAREMFDHIVEYMKTERWEA